MGRKQDRLFDEKNIRKSCKQVNITDDQRNAAIEWFELLKNDKLESEENNSSLFEKIILNRLLGYDVYDYVPEKYDVDYFVEPKSSSKTLCLEIKGTSTHTLDSIDKNRPKEKETPIKQTWNYMSYLPSEYGICTNFIEFAILLGQERTYRKSHRFNFNSIVNSENKIDEEKLKEFVGLFSKKGIFVDDILETLINETINIEEKFTEEFYKLYHETRLMLIKEFTRDESNNESRKDAIHFAQIFLNRLIFIFFVEDHNFIPQKIFTTRLLYELKSPSIDESSHLVFDNILDLFEKMNSGSKTLGINEFNGGLFAKKFPSDFSFLDIRSSDYFKDEFQNSQLKIKSAATDVLLSSSSFSEQVNPIIKNLLIIDSYDFTSDANVNILGHIFEQSISDLEALSEGEISKRKKFGVFYTPDYITDYICRNTIIPYLSTNNSSSVEQLVKEYESNLPELEEKIKMLQILDPACGSGAFLVKAIDILLEIYEEIQKFKPRNSVSQKGIDEYAVTSEINYFLENNIYGVDINEESVEITKLSLFLKLAGNDRKLSYLSNNIKVGNSLIDDKTIHDNAFLWESGDGFPEILNSSKKNPGFDIIIGNPPYVSQKGTANNPNIEYLEREYYRKTYHSLSVEDLSTRGGVKLNLFALWIERSISLLKKNGVLGFIVHKNLLKVESYKFLRKFILENTSITEIFDLGPKIFKDVTGETCIVQINNTKDKTNIVSAKENVDLENNLLNTWGLPQEKFFQNSDYVFNIYRTEKFENLERKLKHNSNKLEECYDVVSFGLNVKDDKNNFKLQPKNSSWKKAVKGKNISKWSVRSYGYVFYDKNVLTRDGDIETFNQNEKLILQRIGTDLIAAFDNEQLYCYNSTNMICLKNPDYSLQYLLCLLNSKLINYYYVIAFSMKSKLTVNITQGYLSELPIKKITDSKNKLESLADEIICLTKEKNLLQNNFIEIISSDLKIEKLSKKLDSYYELDFKDFILELKNKSKKKLSYTKQDELQVYFNENKSKMLKIINHIEKIENEINEFVYDLYDISIEEREIINEFKNERVLYS